MCNPQRGTATVDSTHAHSGTQAVKVVNDFGDAGGPPNYCDHVFFTNVSAFATATPQQVYARFYVYSGAAEHGARDVRDDDRQERDARQR